ncbi:MAG TPA: P1 family peptidase [Chloroflexota bacterium]
MDGGTIADVGGIRVGNWTDLKAATGCTVVLCDRPATGGCFVAGAAPGTRETALLDPTCIVDEVHAVLLSGGSAFGLDAASGVMRYLEGERRGFDVGVARVPIVPAAILFDLGLGSPSVRPRSENGYSACLDATSGDVPQGNVGAGAGATVGKVAGPEHAMKGGLGSSSIRLKGGIVVGALAAVNCAGDVVDPADGRIVAGARGADGAFLDSRGLLLGGEEDRPAPGANTVVAVVATNARLDKAQTNRLARLAYQGLCRTVRPVLPFDGDTIFALSQKEGGEAELGILAVAAAEVLSRALLSGVRAAATLHGCPGLAG